MFRRNERRGGAAVMDLRRRRLAESAEPEAPAKMVGIISGAIREPWGPDGVMGDYELLGNGLLKTFEFKDKSDFVEKVEEIINCLDAGAIEPVALDDSTPGRVTFSFIGDDDGTADPEGGWLYEYDVICKRVVERPMTHAELLRHFKPYGE